MPDIITWSLWAHNMLILWSQLADAAMPVAVGLGLLLIGTLFVLAAKAVPKDES